MRGDARGVVPNRGAITLSIMLANIMQGLDTTIANVALPHIRGSLSASLEQISWVLTSYIVAAAIMGAYSHSRFREIILGGVTRDILRDMNVPVLMAH